MPYIFVAVDNKLTQMMCRQTTVKTHQPSPLQQTIVLNSLITIQWPIKVHMSDNKVMDGLLLDDLVFELVAQQGTILLMGKL